MPKKERKQNSRMRHSVLMWIVACIVVLFAFATIVPAIQKADAAAMLQLSAKKAAQKVTKKKKTKRKKTTAVLPSESAKSYESKTSSTPLQKITTSQPVPASYNY